MASNPQIFIGITTNGTMWARGAGHSRIFENPVLQRIREEASQLEKTRRREYIGNRTREENPLDLVFKVSERTDWKIVRFTDVIFWEGMAFGDRGRPILLADRVDDTTWAPAESLKSFLKATGLQPEGDWVKIPEGATFRDLYRVNESNRHLMAGITLGGRLVRERLSLGWLSNDLNRDQRIEGDRQRGEFDLFSDRTDWAAHAIPNFSILGVQHTEFAMTADGLLWHIGHPVDEVADGWNFIPHSRKFRPIFDFSTGAAP